MKGLVNNSTSTWILRISLMLNRGQLRSHEFLQVYRIHFKHEATCPHYTFTRNLIHNSHLLDIHISFINADGRNAAVDPRQGRVIHQTLPSPPFLIPPTRKSLETKLIAAFSELKNLALEQQYCSSCNVFKHSTAFESSENAPSQCLTAKVHITMSTGSITEAPKIWMFLYYGHTAVLPMVSAVQRGSIYSCAQLFGSLILSKVDATAVNQ